MRTTVALVAARPDTIAEDYVRLLHLAGLQVPGVRIRDPEVVSKSWPKYFEALAGL